MLNHHIATLRSRGYRVEAMAGSHYINTLRAAGYRVERSCAGGRLASNRSTATYCRTAEDLLALAGRVLHQFHSPK